MKQLVLGLMIYLGMFGLVSAQSSAWDDVPATKDHYTGVYMTIPLSQGWLTHNNVAYYISEGWTYSQSEQEIHGITKHKSIDYAVPYGTPIYAPVDGFAQGSYYNTTYGTVGNRKQYRGQSLNYGLGYRVQIIYPDPNDPLNPSKVTYVQLAHLSRLAPDILPSIQGLKYIYDPIEDAVKIDNYSLDNSKLRFILRGFNSRVKAVKRGDLIGYAGTSGLEQGEEVDINYKPISNVIDPRNSWDEAHVHVQIYQRNGSGGKLSETIIDMYNLSGSSSIEYPTHDNNINLTGGHVFVTNDGLLPSYAK